MKPLVFLSSKKSLFKTHLMFFVILLVGIILSILFFPKKKSEPGPLKKINTILPPGISKSSGFYAGKIEVTLISEEKEAGIYYTLDGSSPNINSPLYQNTLSIIDRSKEENTISAIPTSPRWLPPLGLVPKATILRAIAVLNDSLKSEESNTTYFVNVKHNLPVVSLIIDERDFFDNKRGIYVMGASYGSKKNYVKRKVKYDLPWWEYPANYKSRGISSERPVEVQFLNLSGENISVNAGVRIAGNATRAFSQKSLRLKFQYPINSELIFSGVNLLLYRSLILRNSGNDWNKTMLRDVVMQSLLKEFTELDLQYSRPVVVYINGEYWGIHHLTERQDEDYLAGHYNLSRDSITILENNGTVFYGDEFEAYKFKELVEFAATNDIAKSGNYDRVSSLIDIQNFIDYVIAEIYFANTDWPGNNVRFWKKTGDSGKWRWMVSDLDWGMGYTSENAYQLNLFESLQKSNTSIAKLFKSLGKNKEFQELFKNRFRYHLQHTFSRDNVIKILDAKSLEIAGEMKTHIKRWRFPASYKDWENNLEEMKEFAKKRPGVIRAQLSADIP